MRRFSVILKWNILIYPCIEIKISNSNHKKTIAFKKQIDLNLFVFHILIILSPIEIANKSYPQFSVANTTC